MAKFDRLHVIVLAGDEDTGLDSLTRVLTGSAVPKQFAFIAGASLLQQTVAGYARLVPADNIVAVVSARHERLARRQLQRWPGVGVLPRTLNRGPALDTLLALGRLEAHHPDAAVIVAPSHNFLLEPRLLTSALAAATLVPHAAPAILAGAACSSMASLAGEEVGLILPGGRLDGQLWAVRRIVDRPTPALARKLRTAGALWNTGTFGGRVSDLWRLARQTLPGEAATIGGLWSGRTAGLEVIDAALGHLPAKPTAALWREPKELALLPVRDAGWSAWRSPEEVVDSMSDSEQLEILLARIFHRQKAAVIRAAPVL
ncbi:MAG: hypothetical protein ABSB49_09420 [Polyangia bacterium]|jgi:mannose-1-phosphate guanylyltransferase